MPVKFLHSFVFALVAGLVVAPFGAVRAAPQSLALLQTAGPTPLICDGGACKAEFTTYCLQKERGLPATGSPYQAVGNGALHLILTGSDGRVRRIPAAPHIRIRAARATHTAVIIDLPAHALAALGARHAAIEVGDRVTIAPVPVPGDRNPQSAQERRIAAGPLRSVGSKVVDRAGGTVDTVRVLNRLLNAMPDAIEIDPDARTRLWQRALDAGFDGAPASKVARAAEAYAACWQRRHVQLGAYSVRRCLQWRHDGIMWDQVKRYWKAVGAGS